MRDARWMSRFHSDERQVPRYRVGRVLLAGDAAHVPLAGRRPGHEHRPAGRGQPGLEAGRHAARLGRAPGCWTATRPSGTRSAGWCCGCSGGLLRVRSGAVAGSCGCAGRWPASRPGPGLAGAPRRPGRCPASPSGTGGHAARIRWTGRRAPDLPLTDGGRLYEALRDGRFVLVTAAGPGTSTGYAGPAGVARPDRAGAPGRVHRLGRGRAGPGRDRGGRGAVDPAGQERALHRVRDGVQALRLADDQRGPVVDLPAVGAGPVEVWQVVELLVGAPAHDAARVVEDGAPVEVLVGPQ